MIKWFDSRLMSNIPELTNTQGDLVKMLNGLLVNGANLKPVNTMVYANGVCTLDLGANHGFAKNSIVDIQGSIQPAFLANEFVISEVSATNISFNCPSTVTNETGLIARYAPLGFEQRFNSEGRSCYRSADPRYPAYLRVDDTKFASTDDTAAKFAGVEICTDMTDFDTASWQSPFDSGNPLKNRESLQGSNGWFKWYYASAESVNSDSVISPDGNRHYILIGDDTYFWLVIFPYGSSDTKGVVYGFTKANYGNDVKQLLIATNSLTEVVSGRYPHISFINSGAEASIAPIYQPLSFATPTMISLGKNTEGNISFSNITSLAAGDVFLKNPIYLFYGEVLADFLGISTTNHTSTNLLIAGNKKYKAVDIGQSYCVSFNLE